MCQIRGISEPPGVLLILVCGLDGAIRLLEKIRFEVLACQAMGI